MHPSNYNLGNKKTPMKNNWVNREVIEYIITFQETEYKIRGLDILRIMCIMEQIHVLICQRR